MTNPTGSHATVLLQEAVQALVWNPDGIYIDGTFGRGGHSRAILQKLSAAGRLLAIDRDSQAVAEAEQLRGQMRAQGDERFDVEQGSFKQFSSLVSRRNWTGLLSGVLLDLGVSSPQLDDPRRGFSFLRDGPLDMRMDTRAGRSAAQWLATVKEDELMQVLKTYGEEKFSRRIARAIVQQRQLQPIDRTRQLADIVAKAHPAWEANKHPATRTFLAIRLFINGELEELAEVLEPIVQTLQPGGRLVVISFHSLEDRIVKRFLRNKARGDDVPPSLPLREDQLNRQVRIIGKAVKPTKAEVDQNPRARSAVMRVAEKL